jgi:hypothetical protein
VSRRHRDGRDEILHKEDRLAEHRRKRRVSRQVLCLEGEEAVLPQGHDHLHAHRSEKPRDTDSARRARRHWKQPFWKRRMAQRRMKAEAFREVADA